MGRQPRAHFRALNKGTHGHRRPCHVRASLCPRHDCADAAANRGAWCRGRCTAGWCRFGGRGRARDGKGGRCLFNLQPPRASKLSSFLPPHLSRSPSSAPFFLTSVLWTHNDCGEWRLNEMLVPFFTGPRESQGPLNVIETAQTRSTQPQSLLSWRAV